MPHRAPAPKLYRQSPIPRREPITTADITSAFENFTKRRPKNQTSSNPISYYASLENAITNLPPPPDDLPCLHHALTTCDCLCSQSDVYRNLILQARIAADRMLAKHFPVYWLGKAYNNWEEVLEGFGLQGKRERFYERMFLRDELLCRVFGVAVSEWRY